MIPQETYSFPGYVKVVAEAVSNLNIKDFALIGWLLGGHIALEMIDRVEGLRGVLITGTSPIELSPEGITKGFRQMPKEVLDLLGKENLVRRKLVSFPEGQDMMDLLIGNGWCKAV